MRRHTPIVLIVFLLLPTQGLLADNHKSHYQYGVIGSVKKAPTKATRKLKMVVPARQEAVIADPVANSGNVPTAGQKLTAPIRRMITARPDPLPNLIVSVRYEGGPCPQVESRLRKNIYNASCDVIVTVKNVGRAPTNSENGQIRVDLFYFNYRNSIQRSFRLIGDLGINEQKTITYRRLSLKSFNRLTPFHAVVDNEKLITETNESDNHAEFQL